LRTVLSNLGFNNVTDAIDNALGLQKIEERKITHVLFDARQSSFNAKEFLSKALTFDNEIIAIACSYNPTVDDVFGLLVQGARGFLVKPFNQDSVDEALTFATKGDAIPESVLGAQNRNEALSALMMTALDKLAVVLRQSQQFETAKAEVPRRVTGFKRATEIAWTFAQGGTEELLKVLIDFSIDRSSGPASRLGRMRKRRSSARDTGVNNNQDNEIQEDLEEKEDSLPVD
jgi:DNA-binding NarL/FixJ family response regulator